MCAFGSSERFEEVGEVGVWEECWKLFWGEKMPDESAMVEEDATEKEEEGEKREIGKLAVWTVSSNKPGNGVEMLRDNSLSTYWQYVPLSLFAMLLLYLLDMNLLHSLRSVLNLSLPRSSFRVGNCFSDLAMRETEN